MKKGLFVICDRNFSSDNAESNGVVKKIFAQFSVLNNGDTIQCKIINLHHKYKNDAIMVISYLLFDLYKNIKLDLNDLDFIYMRRITPLHYGVIKLFQRIRKINQSCKIVYELPTYPYDKEHKTIRSKVGLCIDRFFRKKLIKYVDRIATVSDDSIIFGIPTIKFTNGINCVNIPIQIPAFNENINLIVVAQFTKWHGYDRLIEGVNNYYKKNIKKRVYVHFVGDGKELSYFKYLVQQYNLSEYITFYGRLTGKRLANVFNKSNLAINSLGSHRIGIYLTSALKSREYLARGLPMISSTKIDVLPPDFKYCLYVPEDESPINMDDIVAFYDTLLINRTVPKMIKEIRQFAEKNCDISKTMLPVIEYINEKNTF
jgi:glycosyltransferase involved in cell wall biosynthesis